MTPRIIAVGQEPAPLEGPDLAPRSNGQHRRGEGAQPKGQATGRFRTLNAFVDGALADLTRAEIATWLTLFRDVRDGTARTGYSDLARRAGLDRRSVGRALRRLKARGLIAVICRGGLGRGPSRYRVCGVPRDG